MDLILFPELAAILGTTIPVAVLTMIAVGVTVIICCLCAPKCRKRDSPDCPGGYFELKTLVRVCIVQGCA